MMATADLRILEEARLAALYQTELLDSPPEHLFDLITALAAKALEVPVVLISLVDAERQFFKSQCGLPDDLAATGETPLSHSFCQYVAAVGEPLVVEDARVHPLVCDNKAVVDIGVIAYAGMPLMTDEGHTLGSFCAIDSKSRRWSSRELEILRDFARQTMMEIKLRMRLKSLGDDLGALRASARDGQAQTRHLVHDLRTPLNAVYLGIDGLAMRGELTSEQKACVELVRKNADALREMMHRLMEAGQRETAAPPARRRCLPHEMVDRALDQVGMLAAKAGVALDSSAVVPLAQVEGDFTDLVRVLVNLIANRVKFTREAARYRSRFGRSARTTATRSVSSCATPALASRRRISGGFFAKACAWTRRPTRINRAGSGSPSASGWWRNTGASCESRASPGGEAFSPSRCRWLWPNERARRELPAGK